MEYYSYNGILFSNKRNGVLIHATTQMNLENIMLKWKKPGTKGNILYDSIYMKYPD